MLCPYCGSEMENGFVRGEATNFKGELCWSLHEDEDKLFNRWKRLAADHYRLGCPVVKAYKCSDCKKVILETCTED